MFRRSSHWQQSAGLWVVFTLILVAGFSCTDRRVALREKADRDIANLVLSAGNEIDASSFHALVDSVREFVNRHTVHDFTKVCDTLECLSQLARGTQNAVAKIGPPLKMLCSHRAVLMMEILKHFGHQVRQGNLINRRDGGHVFLEVLGPDSQWEVADPDFNVFYQRNGRRLSLRDIVFMAPTDYLPCSAKGCGWKITHAKALPLSNLEANQYYGFGFVYGVESYFNSKNFLKDLPVARRTKLAGTVVHLEP